MSLLEDVDRKLTRGAVASAQAQLRDTIAVLHQNPHSRRWVFCTNCGEDARMMAHGLCAPCYQYKWRTGRDRPNLHVVHRCRTCKRRRRNHGRGLCKACYMRHSRHGTLHRFAPTGRTGGRPWPK